MRLVSRKMPVWGGRSYSKWEAVPKSWSIVCKRFIRMSFRLMYPRDKGWNNYVFICSNIMSGIGRGCVIIYLFVEVL